jgi:TonB family protein
MNMMQDWTSYQGQVVDGAFPLGECLGSSRSSAVFLTTDGGAQSPAVMKLIRADGIDQDRKLAVWERISKLSHPNLMPILRFGRCNMDGQEMLYLLTEPADEVLADVLVERPLNPEEAREMLAPVADVLAFLHERGYVHGRVKPANVYAVEELLKISSESVTAVEEAAEASREPGAYDAPEVTAGKWSTAADTWSLGWTIVEALTQQRPGRRTVTAALPPPFEEIAKRCLDPDPGRRWGMAQISACLRGERVKTAAPAVRMRPVAVVGAAAVVVIAVWAWPRIRGDATPPSDPPVPAPPVATALQNRPSAMPPPKPEQRETSRPPALQPTTERVVPTVPAAKDTDGAARRTQPATATKSASPPDSPSSAAAGGVADMIGPAMPEVPARAQRSIRGSFRVGVRVDLDAGGNVTEARLEERGPSSYFAKLALEAARKSKFSAGETGRRRLIQFEFSRRGPKILAVR